MRYALRTEHDAMFRLLLMYPFGSLFLITDLIPPAIKGGNLRTIQLVCSFAHQCRFSQTMKETLLIKAINSCSIEIVNCILVSCGIDEVLMKPFTAELDEAVIGSDNRDIIQKFIKYRNIFKQRSVLDWLDILTKEDNIDVIDMIIGGENDYFRHMPRNPLPFCTKVSTARYLLKHGADPDYRGSDGLSLLHWSVMTRNDEMIALLQEFGALLSPREKKLLDNPLACPEWACSTAIYFCDQPGQPRYPEQGAYRQVASLLRQDGIPFGFCYIRGQGPCLIYSYLLPNDRVAWAEAEINAHSTVPYIYHHEMFRDGTLEVGRWAIGNRPELHLLEISPYWTHQWLIDRVLSAAREMRHLPVEERSIPTGDALRVDFQQFLAANGVAPGGANFASLLAIGVFSRYCKNIGTYREVEPDAWVLGLSATCIPPHLAQKGREHWKGFAVGQSKPDAQVLSGTDVRGFEQITTDTLDPLLGPPTVPHFDRPPLLPPRSSSNNDQ
jgi:hypothetical protein